MNQVLDKTKELFNSLGAFVTKKDKRFRKISMLISAAINDGIKSKGETQKWLAEKLDRKESQVSKWLAGNHNFTIKTVIEIEDALDTEILKINYTRSKANKITTASPAIFDIQKYYAEKNENTLSTTMNLNNTIYASVFDSKIANHVSQG